MKKVLVILAVSISSFGVLAANLEKLTDNEIQSSPHIDSGAACWSYIKDDAYLYSDMTNSIIKIDGKIIKMVVSGPNVDTHSSKEKNLTIKILKNGNMEIMDNGVKGVFKTKSKCGS